MQYSVPFLNLDKDILAIDDTMTLHGANLFLLLIYINTL